MHDATCGHRPRQGPLRHPVRYAGHWAEKCRRSRDTTVHHTDFQPDRPPRGRPLTNSAGAHDAATAHRRTRQLQTSATLHRSPPCQQAYGINNLGRRTTTRQGDDHHDAHSAHAAPGHSLEHAHQLSTPNHPGPHHGQANATGPATLSHRRVTGALQRRSSPRMRQLPNQNSPGNLFPTILHKIPVSHGHRGLLCVPGFRWWSHGPQGPFRKGQQACFRSQDKVYPLRTQDASNRRRVSTASFCSHLRVTFTR